MAKLSTSTVFGDLLVDGTIFGNVTGNLTGNASTATSATTATSASKWSTARTLTIGNTGKSVDGSADASWTLAEIGAAASDHSHSNYISGTGSPGVTTVADANTIWKSGFYDANNGTNYPTTSGWYWLIHAGHVNNRDKYNYGLQITGANNTSDFYMRTVNESGKGTWQKLYHEGNKPSLSDLGAAAASHGTHLSLGTTSSTAYRGDYGNTAYTHSQAAHAPSNAQKNSDITKAEIEAKLTGAITSHTHSYAGSSSAGGAATSANKLATSRTLTVGGTGKSFDGSGNVSWTLSEILNGTGSISLAGGASTYCDGTFYTCDFIRLSDKLIAAPANNDNRFFQFLDSGGSAVGGYFATVTVKDKYITFGSAKLYMQTTAPTSGINYGDVWIDI